MRERLWIGLLLFAGLPMMVGCPLLYGLAVLDGAAIAERRIADKPCGDSACRRDDWRVLRVTHVGVIATWPEDDSSYDFELEDDTHIVSASGRASDALLALLTKDGQLMLGALGDPAPVTQPLDGPGVGVSWSNSGERLAVLIADEGSSHRLQVLGDDFAVQQEWPVDLPATPRPDVLWRYVLSWSADDRWISITVDSDRGADTPLGRVLRVADGLTFEFGGFNAYFLDGDTLVGRTSNELQPGLLKTFDLNEAGVTLGDKIEGPSQAVASDPVAGVFASVEDQFFGSLATFPIGLRTRTAGADLVSGHAYVELGTTTVIILPRD